MNESTLREAENDVVRGWWKLYGGGQRLSLGRPPKEQGRRGGDGGRKTRVIFGNSPQCLAFVLPGKNCGFCNFVLKKMNLWKLI